MCCGAVASLAHWSFFLRHKTDMSQKEQRRVDSRVYYYLLPVAGGGRATDAAVVDGVGR